MRYTTKTTVFAGLWSVLTVAILGAIGTHIAQDTGHDTTTIGTDHVGPYREAAAIEEMDELRAKIESLVQEVARLHRQSVEANEEIRSLRVRVSENALEDPGGSLAEPTYLDSKSRMTQRRALVNAEMRAQKESIEVAIRTESTDHEWTNWAETALTDAFRSPEFQDLQLLDAECRSTLCRVRFYVEATGPVDFGQLQLGGVVASLPWLGESWFRIENDESGEGVLYLARAGRSLPRESRRSDSEANSPSFR